MLPVVEGKGSVNVIGEETVALASVDSVSPTVCHCGFICYAIELHRCILCCGERQVDIAHMESWPASYYVQFTECMVIGRDLVRYLQGVARVPAVATLWNDLWSKPSSFSPSFTNIAQVRHVSNMRLLVNVGLSLSVSLIMAHCPSPDGLQLLNRRTPRKYIQSRIPPLMETHLNFLLSNVRGEMHAL